MIVIRVVRGNSEERGKKNGRISKNEIEWETLKNTNEDEKVNTNPVESNEVKLDNNSKEKKEN